MPFGSLITLLLTHTWTVAHRQSRGCCIETRLTLILFKQETHNHNQFAPKYPSCHDLGQNSDLQRKLYLQNQMQDKYLHHQDHISNMF